MSSFPQVIPDFSFFFVINDCYLPLDFILSCVIKTMTQLLLCIFVFSTEGDHHVQIPAFLFPLACTFMHKKSGGG